MLARLLVYLEILRPHNMVVAAFAVATGYHAAGGRGVDGVLWIAALCALATGAGNVANDVFDADIDRVNKPKRPLVTGAISLRQAWWFTWVFYALALFPTWLVVPYPYESWAEKAAAPQGVGYASAKLPEGRTFVILLALEGAENPLTAVPEFRDFQQRLPGWLAGAPTPEQLTVVGSYNLF